VHKASSAKPAILFDLGNTLAGYYHADQFMPILEASVAAVLAELESLDLARVSFDTALASAVAENTEAADFRLRPMADRLARIFDVALVDDAALAATLCAKFLGPIFAVGQVYDDTFPALAALRADGHRLAIVSNAPWGSPPPLWRAELTSLGLAPCVDSVVLCGDVGWRKPAPEIFRFAAAALGREPAECVFVGDDLRWDVAGSEAVGMRPILIDRDRRHPEHAGARIESLRELPALIAGGPDASG
jgi:putative hydrolase of the HAD superfamily